MFWNIQSPMCPNNIAIAFTFDWVQMKSECLGSEECFAVQAQNQVHNVTIKE